MPDTSANLPYQAYKSKRHSHTTTSPGPQQPRFAASISSPPNSRPASFIASTPTTPPISNGYSPQPSPNGVNPWEKEQQAALNASKSAHSPPLPVIVLDPTPSMSNSSPSSPTSPTPSNLFESLVNQQTDEPAKTNGTHNEHGFTNGAIASSSKSPTQNSIDLPSPSTPSSSLPTVSDDRPRKTSTFRRVPRNTRPPLQSSPLASGHSRTVSTSSMQPSPRPSLPSSEQPSYTEQRPTSMLLDPRQRIPSSTSERPPAISSSSDGIGNRRHSTPLNADAVAASLASVTPPMRTSSLAASPTPSTSISRANSYDPSRQTSPAPTPVPLSPSTQNPPRATTSAPYRPGFQPKGVYRPRTDEFIAHRKAHAITAGYASADRTKLERRLEKLIALHFPEEGKSTTGVGRRPGIAPNVDTGRRASSFFDLDIKSILSGGSGKEDVRSAEQRITPWQEDSAVAKCPLCTTNFHPLTNRKHHCRLCGQIICALPIKRPQRPQLCSVLFVVDPKTRNIEEVGEGVDYGVRKRRTSSVGGAKELETAEEEKFLRGVRICNQCRPVMLRQQYQQQGRRVPMFVKLYEAFVVLEKEIEDSLPQFQELILTLNHDAQPSKEASAARKRLLEAFAQYDALAKRIRNLPTSNGKGSSQERVQIAVMTRANLFLQKNMFPLQSLPTPKHSKAATSSIPVEDDDGSLIDPTSTTALALQPLLEQEALLETFVEEAKAQRKFEDAKTLRINLGEIREEIERVLAADGMKGRRTRKGR
ncbi:FYVE-type domain-containing protein [Favolaschia claudopus]|uniref:FYVE-type domain-containing protein n=1 Tax=Favolaschia claudopus TaxID=2862362 RepID=A0AAW0C880_9AGAR